MPFCLFLLLLFFMPLQNIEALHKVGRDPEWYPHNFHEKTPYVNAFTNQLIQKMQELESTEAFLLSYDSLDLFSYLADQKVEAILTSITPDVITRDLYDFSETFLAMGPLLVVNKNSKITALEQLKEKKVGVPLFGTSIFIVQRFPTLIIESYLQIFKALDDLDAHKIDAVLLPALGAHALIDTRYAKTLKIVSGPLNSEGLRMITLKDKNAELLSAFNATLETLKKRNLLTKMQQNLNLY